MQPYIPAKGDFIVLSFDPQSGHEQKGRRPAFVISNTMFNKRTGLAFVCPITNTHRGSRFHVPVPAESGLSGFIMSEQIKSLDFAARHAQFVAKAPRETLDEVLALVDAIVY
jgi:mRNA interferase MazF